METTIVYWGLPTYNGESNGKENGNWDNIGDYNIGD